MYVSKAPVPDRPASAMVSVSYTSLFTWLNNYAINTNINKESAPITFVTQGGAAPKRRFRGPAPAPSTWECAPRAVSNKDRHDTRADAQSKRPPFLLNMASVLR